MKVELARVMAVNVLDYSVDVLTDTGSTPYIGVPILTPWCTPDHMGGINFLPEVGATCYICTADGSYFVLGFRVNGGTVDPDRSPGPNFTGKRDPLEPGDIVLATADENQVVLRRGGLVQIGSTGLCQRIYVPIGNVIRDYFQRYHALSPLGEIDWGHAQIAANDSFKDGSTSVAVRYNVKRTLQEDVTSKPYTLEVRYGVLTGNTGNAPGILDTSKSDAVHQFANLKEQPGNLKQNQPGTGVSQSMEGTLSFTIYNHAESGNNPNKVVYAFQVSKEGDNFIVAGGHVHMEFAKTLYVYAGEHITLETASGSNVRIRVGANDEIKLGSDEASNPAVLGNELKAMLGSLLNYIVAHTHAAPGTSVPLNVAAFEALRANFLTPGAVLIHSDTVKIRN